MSKSKSIKAYISSVSYGINAAGGQRWPDTVELTMSECNLSLEEVEVLMHERVKFELTPVGAFSLNSWFKYAKGFLRKEG